MDTVIKTNIIQFFQQQSEIFPDEYYFENITKIVNNSFDDCKESDPSENPVKSLIGIGNQDSDLVFVCDNAFNIETSKILTDEANNLFIKILSAIDIKDKDIYLTYLQDDDGNYKHIFNNQLSIIKPRVIICLGHSTGKKLIKMEKSATDTHGKVFKYHGYDLVVTFHPDEVLKDSSLKRPVWEDFKKIKTFRS